MPKTKQSVRHVMLTLPAEELDAEVSKWVNADWRLLEARLQKADFINNFYSVFYIFVKDA